MYMLYILPHICTKRSIFCFHYRKFLAALQLDKLHLDAVDTEKPLLPQALIERCAALNAKPTVLSDADVQMES